MSETVCKDIPYLTVQTLDECTKPYIYIYIYIYIPLSKDTLASIQAMCLHLDRIITLVGIIVFFHCMQLDVVSSKTLLSMLFFFSCKIDAKMNEEHK